MQDRVPSKPNRYAVYDDAHNFLRYEYHERADEPTQVGDALNKANLLPDAVATTLGLTGNPQVKDAFEKTKTLIDGNTTLANSKAQIETGSYTGTGTYGSDNPSSYTFSGVVPGLMIISRGGAKAIIPAHALTTSFTIEGTYLYDVPKFIYAKKSEDGKTIYWYQLNAADYQLNKSSATYSVMGIG